MEEIKFRAWDKEGKNMWELGHLADIAYNADFEEEYGDDLTKYEIMQYTGLEDFNGAEICQGDVVEWQKKDEGCDSWGWGLVQVVLKDGAFRVSGTGDLLYSVREEVESLEIVGNIYENPELLNKLNK